MKKKDVQKLVKDKMQQLGFTSIKTSKNAHYKIFNNNYLVGIHLEHHPYCKGYFIDCGVIYLYDEQKEKFTGCNFDYGKGFLFTKESEDNLKNYNLEDRQDDNLTDYFEYDIRSQEEFEEALDTNLKFYLGKFYNQQYLLNLFSNDLSLFRAISDDFANKMLYLTGVDKVIVDKIRDTDAIEFFKNGYTGFESWVRDVVKEWKK
ncbi:MAG: hypothetical protein Q4F84_03995 [Fibrobacter sp.]|nr:hypothetical protein [Fibrobacter sp.]